MGLIVDNNHEKNLAVKEQCPPLSKEMQISVVGCADMGLKLINFKSRNDQCGNKEDIREVKRKPRNVNVCKSRDSDWCRRHCKTENNRTRRDQP